MHERHRTCSRATAATKQALWMALNLHARHHFTAAAAVDGSLIEDITNGRLRRSLTYGVNEGAATATDNLWGGTLPPDMEVPDAEMYAIHAYLTKCARQPAHINNAYSYKVTASEH